MKIHVPPAVRWICRTLEAAGHETWTVGGAVRDALAGTPSGDWDLTTKARPKEVRRLFRRTVPLGMEHGTVGVLARDGTLYEVTTFRRDVETDGRHAVVAFADTVEEDLARRDFTINAIAWHPDREVLKDPWNGAQDLRDRVLRTVGSPEERFQEDYLRILRALRFAGRYGLQIDAGTWAALTAGTSGLGRLSPERIREELEKAIAPSRILNAPPSQALNLYASSGVLERVYPELASASSSVWAHALAVTDRLADRTRNRDLPLAALLSTGGDTLSAVAILTRLRFSNARIRDVGALAGALAEVPTSGHLEGDPVVRRRWLAKVGRVLLPQILRLVAASAAVAGDLERRDPSVRATAARALRALRREARSGAPLSQQELALTGRDLIRAGYRPGPAFGRVFDKLFDAVLEDPRRNEPAWLMTQAEGALAELATPDPATPDPTQAEGIDPHG